MNPASLTSWIRDWVYVRRSRYGHPDKCADDCDLCMKAALEDLSEKLRRWCNDKGLPPPGSNL